MNSSDLPDDWKFFLSVDFKPEKLNSILCFIQQELSQKKIIYPLMNDLFQCFKLTPAKQVKVVILGQDPYHGPLQAHGLSFSVQEGVSLPPSLKNIFKELHSDLNLPLPKIGDLSAWAKQGVLLLNTVLSVEKGKPGSHQDIGWEAFTDLIIKKLSDDKEHLVFILWGSPAQKKINLINEKKHLILKAPHPSPLSSYRGFFGSKPFSKTNTFLKTQGQKEINWNL
jgi:uracil-DNA glycosylase